MNRAVFVAILLVLALTFAGCPRNGSTDDGNVNQSANVNGSTNDNSAANENDNVNLNADLNDNANANDNSADDSESSLFGAWHRTSTETMHGAGDTELDYMVLNEDYTAGLHFRSPGLGIIACNDGLFAPGPGIMFLACPALFPGTMMGQYEMADENTFSLCHSKAKRSLSSGSTRCRRSMSAASSP
jgi:hypothetical protein